MADYENSSSHNQGVYVNFYSLSTERLKAERKRLGLNQAGAAEQCGVSREIWGRYERGLAVPGGEVLFSFANAGADVQYILTGVRSSVSSVEEHLVLERFRSSPQNLKDAALRVLLGESSDENTQQTFKDVGQYIHGSVNQSGVTFNVGGSKGKK
ncbi:helix-turn-helix domain-containing protein [Pseudomonas sp. NPDC087346]|uniref:helix-turn-helix domain-containing protein n=1 Tax=Pseudomonas sp. NPDC087346 TaxID=3364438 RepID=UPI00382D010E